MRIVITVALAVLVGTLFMKWKVPGGMLIGAVIGVAALNIITGNAYLWPQTKVFAQAFTGAYIGCMVTKDSLKKLPRVLGPYLFVMSSFFLMNLCVGLLIHRITDLDLLTCFLCAMPGGMSDTPLIALDMGADSASVALLQFVRLLFGLSCLPSIIAFSDRKVFSKANPETVDNPVEHSRATVKKQSTPLFPFLPTLFLAVIAGFIGRKSGIPAGAMAFSLVAVSLLRISGKAPSMPIYLRRTAQVISGCCIGCTVTRSQLQSLGQLTLPAVIVCASFLALCLCGGLLIAKLFHIQRREAMLFLSPAGASEMILIAADIGVESTDLAVLQICRLIGVMLLFPQLFQWIARLVT